jgi:hypothetical protein
MRRWFFKLLGCLVKVKNKFKDLLPETERQESGDPARLPAQFAEQCEFIK